MTNLRSVTVAYNGVAVAGEDRAYQIERYSWDQSPGSVSLGVDILVAGTSATDLATSVDRIRALDARNGDFVVQVGKELNLADLVGDGTTTATSATGGFTAAHEGLWLSIRGIGSRKIVTRNSSTSVTLDTSVATGTYRAILPAKHFAGTHAANTFYESLGSLRRNDASPLNTEFTQLWTLTVSGKVPIKGLNGLTSASVSISYDASRRRTARLSGTYSVFDDSGTIKGAKTAYDEDVATFVTNHLSGFGGESAYERINEENNYNALADSADYAASATPQKAFSFTRVYQERFVADAAAIIAQTLAVTRSQTTPHGLGKVGSVQATVRYGCAVDHEVTVHTGLRALYVGTIRSLINTAIQNATGATRVVIERESYAVDQSANTMSADWQVMLPDLSDNILEYDESITVNEELGRKFVPLWDGVPHTYAEYNMGETRTRTQVVTIKSLKPLKYKPLSNADLSKLSTGGGGGAGGAGFFVAGVIDGPGVSIGGGPRGGGALGATFTWPSDQGVGGGQWRQQGSESVSQNSDVIGKTVDGGVFAQQTIHVMGVTRNYVWVQQAAAIKPTFKPIGGSGEKTGAEGLGGGGKGALGIGK